MKSRHVGTVPIGMVMGLLCAQTAPAQAQDSEPMMDRDRTVHCEKDTRGELWRIQCDEETKTCLYAPNAELDTAGQRSQPLERAKACPITPNPFDMKKLESEGYQLQSGRPDAPHGWTRDERGRVFQVNFDLLRRIYLGAGYAPIFQAGTETEKNGKRSSSGKRTSIDFGGLIFETYGGPQHPNRHRIRLVEGDVQLAPFSANLVLVHYDLSRRFLNPLLRLTTFVGKPRRYDLSFDLGLWTEAGALEVHRDTSLWKFGVAMMTLDLWQSARLDSFVRLRSGFGIERMYSDDIGDRSAVTAATALDARWIVDDAGFHNLNLTISHEKPRYWIPSPDTGRWARRMKARIEYEAILLAINDQPVSLAIGAGAERRDDLPDVPDRWALVADTGLRFSLWAPPRPR